MSCFIQELLSQVMARLAVPMFFVFAGYLLYQGKSLDPEGIKRKLLSRYHRLFIPYLVWNTLTLISQVIGQAIPQTARYFTGSTFDIHNISPPSLVNAYVGLDGSPVNGPLWFVRDLIILVVLSPILYAFLRKLKRFGFAFVALFGLVWVSRIDSFPVLGNESAFFFLLGMQFSLLKPSRLIAMIRDRRSTGILFLIYICQACMEAILRLNGNDTHFLHRYNIILGCLAIFGVGRNWIRNTELGCGLANLATDSYPVFLIHASVLRVFAKLFDTLPLPETALLQIVAYLLPAMITIYLIVRANRFLQSKGSELWRIAVGNSYS